jgi:uncharacterized membrane protein
MIFLVSGTGGQVLQRRFAAGEIGPDEYHERKKIIEMDYIKQS